jgi:hypothetical protein
MKHGIKWLVDADISGFFDNIDKAQLREMLKQRVNDGGLMRLIGKWLNTGVVEGDVIGYSEKGTPQGGTISPVLANIYLHHVLDDWFVKDVQPRMKGYCFIVRFADDFVIGCQYEEDARRIMKVLPKRFDRFGLTVHPEKTKLIAFGKPAQGKGVRRGEATFDFLGFTHYWAKSLNGYWVIKRKTARKKVRKTIAARQGIAKHEAGSPRKPRGETVDPSCVSARGDTKGASERGVESSRELATERQRACEVVAQCQ